jgi:hypothetical protein
MHYYPVNRLSFAKHHVTKRNLITVIFGAPRHKRWLAMTPPSRPAVYKRHVRRRTYPSISTTSVNNAIDSLMRGFRKRVIRIGRGYQGQSIALIALCRHLAENDINLGDNDLQMCCSVIPRTVPSHLILF